MLHDLFKKHWADNRGILALLIGFAFSSLSLLICRYLFRHTPHLIGLTTVFFTVILTMPVLTYVLSLEEKLERKKGSFFHKNEAIIDFYLYFFVGVFLLFLMVSFIQPSYVYSKNDFYNVDTQAPRLRLKLPPPSVNDLQTTYSIIKNNLFIVLITFVLSLLFGAGSIYLIVFNASMAASALRDFILSNISGNFWISFLCNFGVFSLHLIPEMLGYLIAAIAGGVLLVDFKHEKLFSKSFDEVSFESLLLLLLAVVVIVVAGFIEVFISGKLLIAQSCSRYFTVILLCVVLLIAGIISLEKLRPRKNKKSLRK